MAHLTLVCLGSLQIEIIKNKFDSTNKNSTEGTERTIYNNHSHRKIS